MGVMIEEELFNGPPINSKLRTKHVHDWRLKPFEQGKKWLRRSRLVAGEFAWEKRSDTFSPATSSHTMNVLPVVYLERLAEEENSEGLPSGDPCTLGVVDIKDAFLMVDQQEPQRFSQQATLSCSRIYQGKDWAQRIGFGTFMIFFQRNCKWSGVQNSLACARIPNVP